MAHDAARIKCVIHYCIRVWPSFELPHKWEQRMITSECKHATALEEPPRRLPLRQCEGLQCLYRELLRRGSRSCDRHEFLGMLWVGEGGFLSRVLSVEQVTPPVRSSQPMKLTGCAGSLLAGRSRATT
jgi:hypothetical protein